MRWKMTSDERLELERDAFRKWMERFSSEQCVKLLGDVYSAINYKQNVELNLKGGWIRAN